MKTPTRILVGGPEVTSAFVLMGLALARRALTGRQLSHARYLAVKIDSFASGAADHRSSAQLRLVACRCDRVICITMILLKAAFLAC